MINRTNTLNPAAKTAAAKREVVNGSVRVNARKVIREIAVYFKIGKEGASDLKSALVRNARLAGKTYKAYVSNFWAVITAKGGLKKVQKTKVMKGDLFAFV